MKISLLTFSLLSGLYAPLSLSAPLDALLDAIPHYRAGVMRLEASYDAVNKTLDVFNVRANDPIYGGTNVGDYKGFHLRGGYGLTDQLWLEGSLWQRNIAYRGEVENITSWQTALQYRLSDRKRQDGQYAVRLSAWGNYSPRVNKASPTTLPGINLQSVSVAQPQDLQLQADVIGTWPFFDNTTLISAFAGAGVSRITVGALTGKVNGCDYNIISNALGTSASLVAPCGNLVSASLSSPSTLAQWLSYNSRYYQLGGKVQWEHGKWQTTLGYQYQYHNRDQIDAAIVQRGGIAYKSNHVVIAEVAHQYSRGVTLFARAQVMRNQFNGEMPFTYNSITASKFGQLYGFASFGARFTF